MNVTEKEVGGMASYPFLCNKLPSLQFSCSPSGAIRDDEYVLQPEYMSIVTKETTFHTPARQS